MEILDVKCMKCMKCMKNMLEIEWEECEERMNGGGVDDRHFHLSIPR